MRYTGDATTRLSAFCLALGALGGGASIMTTMLSSRGPLIFIPYALILLVAAIYLRSERIPTFQRRFLATFGAFMSAVAVHYVFLMTVVNPRTLEMPFVGHAWRIAVMAAIGAVVGAAVAQLTATRPVP